MTKKIVKLTWEDNVDEAVAHLIFIEELVNEQGFRQVFQRKSNTTGQTTMVLEKQMEWPEDKLIRLVNKLNTKGWNKT